VPLLDENRILAREGLRRLASTQKHGLRALMKVGRLKDGLLTLRGGDVGFASGRASMPPVVSIQP
jgi:single-stranded-DNA-specific exonuclease